MDGWVGGGWSGMCGCMRADTSTALSLSQRRRANEGLRIQGRLNHNTA